MLLALMLLMLGMAAAEEAAEDDWQPELIGRAIELVRQMDAQEQGSLFGRPAASSAAAIDRGRPQKAFISADGMDGVIVLMTVGLMLTDEEAMSSSDEAAMNAALSVYARIAVRAIAEVPEYGLAGEMMLTGNDPEGSAAASLLYAGDAPEMGMLLLSYGENGAVMVRWFAENGGVCLTAVPTMYQPTEWTADELVNIYQTPFEEVDLSRAAILVPSAPHQPDEDTLRQLALQSAQEMQDWAEKQGGDEAVIPWNTAETAVQISKMEYEASQTLFEAQMQRCGRTDSTILDMLATALYPCDAHDAGGMLYLQPEEGTLIVVAWQAMNGAVMMRSMYAPQE